MKNTWYFPTNAHGQKQGFNDAGINTFDGDPVGALVRESIQNSLDAKEKNDGPVRVSFTLTSLDKDSKHLASGLLPAMTLGLKKAKKDGHAKATAFYKQSVELLESDQPIQVLGIHDFGTTGLTGTTDDELDDPSAWLALVKGTGETVKQVEGAGGSYGHGSSAPLALSQLRSVLYYSLTTQNDSVEERFQGTSRLQSLPAETLIGHPGWTQGQGHFGDGEKCGPLYNDDIPKWIKDQRNESLPGHVDGELGTSIFVLSPDTEKKGAKFWEAVAVAVLANYYYTIARGWLEVYIGPDYALTSESVASFLAAIPYQTGEETDVAEAVTIDRLESSRTIAGEHTVHSLQIPNFGSVDLLLRLDDSIQRSRVGVARSSGMLITREPWMLGSDRFKAHRPFDLFVYVSDPEGSELLRRLEPPAHDAFELKRIDSADRARVKKIYSKFKQAIIDFLRDSARYEAVDELIPEELSKYFVANWSGEIVGDNDPTNYSKVYSSFRRVRAKQGVAVWGNPEDTVGVSPRIGQTVRGNKKKGLEPNFDDPLGEFEKPNKKTRRQVEDFRVVRDSKDPNIATVHLTPVDKVHRHLEIRLSGADLITEKVRFKTEKGEEWLTELDLAKVAKGQRRTLRLQFEPGVLVYSLEASLTS